jgi:hypothetical protein
MYGLAPAPALSSATAAAAPVAQQREPALYAVRFCFYVAYIHIFIGGFGKGLITLKFTVYCLL